LRSVLALYINKGANPFVQKAKPVEVTGGTPATEMHPSCRPPPNKPAKTAEAKPLFDFYKILRGTEER